MICTTFECLGFLESEKIMKYKSDISNLHLLFRFSYRKFWISVTVDDLRDTSEPPREQRKCQSL